MRAFQMPCTVHTMHLSSRVSRTAAAEDVYQYYIPSLTSQDEVVQAEPHQCHDQNAHART